MKTIVPLLLAFVFGGKLLAQTPFLNLMSEEVTITEPALSTIQSVLGAAPHTIRLYANIPEDWELQVVYGNSFDPWSLDCAGLFYQDPNGGPTTLDINETLYPIFPEVAFDSWITVGYENAVDNSLLLSPVSGVFFNNWESGSNLLVNDLIGGAVSVLAVPTTFPPNTGDVNGNVLIAQLTGSGDFSGCLSFQLRRLNPDGTIFLPVQTVIFSDVCFTHIFPSGTTCTADFDTSGAIATPDLLLLLGDYNCDGTGCMADLSGDDKTNTTDLLLFLGQYGNICP